jgi:hypothetical protein
MTMTLALIHLRERETEGDLTPRSEEEGCNFSVGVADHLRGEPELGSE